MDTTPESSIGSHTRSRELKRVWLVGAVVCIAVVAIGGGAWALATPTPPNETVYPDDVPFIEYDEARLAEYPEVRECLVSSEQEAEKPNLVKMNWKLFIDPSFDSLSICIKNIFNVLISFEKINIWLGAHGHDESVFIRKKSDKTNIYTSGIPIFLFEEKLSLHLLKKARDVNPLFLRQNANMVISYGINKTKELPIVFLRITLN